MLPKITLPGGYAPEEGKAAGDIVDVLVKLKILGDTEGEIVSLDGAAYDAAEVEEGGEEEEIETEDMEDDAMDASSEAFGSRLETAMGAMK